MGQRLWNRFIVVCLTGLALTGCAQRETSVGEDAAGLRTDVEFSEIRVLCAQDTVWHPKVSNGYSQSLQWGLAEDFYAVSLLRFEPSSALPDSFRVDSNRLVLRGVTTLPDESVPSILAKIRLITDAWSEDSVRIDNLPQFDSYPILMNYLTMTSGATDSFEVRLPDSLVAKWLEGDTLNWGITIEPEFMGLYPEDVSLFMREFYSGESGLYYAPALYLYGVGYDTTDEGVWESSELDTFAQPVGDTYLAWNYQPPIEGRMMIMQGYAQRCLLYFALEDVLPDFGVSIVHSELILWADVLNEANFGSVTLLKHGTLMTNAWRTDLDSVQTDQIAITSTPFDAEERVIFDVTALISDWVQEPGNNHGFFITSSGENQALGRRVLYNRLAEDTTFVPELRIWYATAH